MKLKTPPVIVVLLFGLFMYLVAKFLPVGHFDFFGRPYLSKTLLLGAIVISLTALFQFYRIKTTVDPMAPSKTSDLVTKGIYGYSRNPMYLAMLLILLAWGLRLGNAFNTLSAALFVAYMNRFQIAFEEQALSKTFGKKYQQYCLQVRRWF